MVYENRTRGYNRNVRTRGIGGEVQGESTEIFDILILKAS